MRINKLHLKNFRLFRDWEIAFTDKNFTVLIGANGTGKTTVLDAISVAIGGLLGSFDEVKKTRHIVPDEAHIDKFGTGNFESQFPVEVHCECQTDQETFIWKRALRGKKNRTTSVEPKQIVYYANRLTQQVRSNEDVILPVFAYYGTGRLWSQKRDRSVDLFESGSRFLGYTDCLEPKSDEKLFTRWFKKWVLIELQEQEEQGVLTAVRNAIETCMESLSEEHESNERIRINYNLKLDEVQVTLENGKTLPLRMLSDGYRNIIGMVADIAYRMAVLNPHLQGDVARHTPGIILIDEIDMHLHPRWQRNIVRDLKRTFPEVQFITTTHSPFIIQSLEQGELHVLDDAFKGDYEDMSIEDVTENVMGIDLPQWSKRRHDMNSAAAEYYRVLREMKTAPVEQHNQLRDKLDALSKPYINNVAYYAFLEQERLLTEAEIWENKNETDQ